MTYRDLIEKLSKLTTEQLDQEVTYEDVWQEECFGLELRICDERNYALEEGDPFFYPVMVY